MSHPLAEYLSALETRDVREKAHEGYIHAYTKLADRTAAAAAAAAALNQPPAITTDQAAPSPTISTKSIRPDTPKGKKSPAPPELPSNVAQLRSELASTQKTRGELESKVSLLTTELSTLKTSDTQQKQRISQLEKVKMDLERRVRDRADELKGKGRFVEEVQDEMVALNLQLNMAEKEKEKLKQENEDLTRRWVQKMEAEASKMNDQMGWQDGRK